LLAFLVASYAIANLTASLLSLRRNNHLLLPLMPIVFATLHLAYGLGFLTGFAKFWKHWRENKTPSPSLLPFRDAGNYEHN